MLRIRLVGDLHLDLDGREVEPIASGRARSLLAWLAYHPGLHTRTRVASVFWPAVLDSSARASLRTTLATLRRELGEAAGAVLAERERVGLDNSVWIDLRESERLAAEGRYEQALALAEGELLTDLDDDWVLEERSTHRARMFDLLALLGEAAEQAGDLDAAVRHSRRRLELDAVSEDAARTLMRRLGRAGDSAAAVVAYESFRRALARELGMAPSAETRALVEELRLDRGAHRPAAPLPAALTRADLAPLVGRGDELARLRDEWRRASAGAARVVSLTGEAGSGKTRLLIALAEEARAGGATVLAGRCVEDAVVAFAPFTEALRQHFETSPETLPGWVAAELARLLPELSEETAPAQGDPRDVRHRLFEAVAAAIGAAARRAPVLLVVEDLHLADDATLGMLGHVVRTVGWAPLLIAGSFRDEAGPRLDALLQDLRREQRLEQVALAGLPETEVRELVAAWLGERPPPGLAEAVQERTRGNPLFVEELVRHLIESGQPIERMVKAATTELPVGVRAVIDQRLIRLPEQARAAVTAAAVIGEDFTLADVAAVCEASEATVADSLDAAVRTGLIDESPTAGKYRFAHALVRGALLAGLTATRRALLHRRMSEVLEALPDERRAARLPELARHLLDAAPLADASKTARVALRAAEQAMRRLAYEDAADLLERALAGDLADADRGQVLVVLGDVRARLGDASAAEHCFEEAAAVARVHADGELLARAALGSAGLTVNVAPVREVVRALLQEGLDGLPSDSTLRPRLLARLAIESYYARPVTLREQLSDEAVEAGRRTGGRALLEALGARHVALWSPAHTEERLRIADELIATARSLGDQEAELQGVNWRVTDLVELGEMDAARGAIDDHERLAEGLRLLGYAWWAPMWRAMLALMAARLDEARRLSSEGDRIGRAAQDANAELLFWVQGRAISNSAGELTDADLTAIEQGSESSPAAAAWRMWAAGVAFSHGDRDRAEQMVRAEVKGLASLPLDANWLYTAAALGVRIAELGDAEAAATVYPRLLPYRGRTVTSGRASFCGGSAELSLGLLAAAAGDREAAAAHLEAAVRRNEELGAAPYASAARQALAGVTAGEPALDLRHHLL